MMMDALAGSPVVVAPDRADAPPVPDQQANE